MEQRLVKNNNTAVKSYRLGQKIKKPLVSSCFMNRREGRCRNNSWKRLRLTLTWGRLHQTGGHHKLRRRIGWTDPCCITDWLKWVSCFLWFFCCSFFFPLRLHSEHHFVDLKACVWLFRVPAGFICFVSVTLSWMLESVFWTVSLHVSVCILCVHMWGCVCFLSSLNYGVTVIITSSLK